MPSPNFGAPRARTVGIIIHSTRGGAPEGTEYEATLRWFQSPASQVSAHAVIARDGRRARCVPDDLAAWHAGYMNTTYIGVELEQSRPGDDITEEQYVALQDFIDEMTGKYGALELVEHYKTPQGIAAKKSDVGPPFDLGRLRAA